MRFIILSQPRSGSTLLAETLNSHPEIRCLGEVLNPDDVLQVKLPEKDGTTRNAAALTAHPNIKATGCKLLAYQPVQEFVHWGDAWNYLAADSQLRVICLWRYDALAKYASWKIADLLKKWRAQRQGCRPRITINREHFADWADAEERHYRGRLEMFRTLLILTVSYESLCTHWSAVISQILKFLDVADIPLPQSMAKGEHRPLSEVITNYDEIASQFRAP